MKPTQTLLAAVILGTGLFTATAQAASVLPPSQKITLQTSLNGQAVYDTDLNITWLANANLAATNTFGLATDVNLGTDIYGYQSIIFSAGYMTWGGAQKWIAAMNAANYLGYHDWRLPATLYPDVFCSNQGGDMSYSYNCTRSEMGHLFYSELGGVAGNSIATTHNANYGLFQNVESGVYWSGTEYAPGRSHAWDFDFRNGGQRASSKDNPMYALAVRPGQVAAVPVPAAAWLFGSGLLGLIGFARRKARAYTTTDTR